jgi:hypothetical protein
MATPKERNDERERAATERAEAERARKSATPEQGREAGRGAQQQGDGQPENAREIEDRSSGAALTGGTDGE